MGSDDLDGTTEVGASHMDSFKGATALQGAQAPASGILTHLWSLGFILLLLEVTPPKKQVNSMYKLARSTPKMEIRRLFQTITRFQFLKILSTWRNRGGKLKLKLVIFCSLNLPEIQKSKWLNH